MNRDITKTQAEYLDVYLEKSGDNIEDFNKAKPGLKVLDFPDTAWVEYGIFGDTFLIETAFSKLSHKETKIIWDRVVKLAKDCGCTTIKFNSSRNPKAWKRLFKAYPIEYIFEVDITKE